MPKPEATPEVVAPAPEAPAPAAPEGSEFEQAYNAALGGSPPAAAPEAPEAPAPAPAAPAPETQQPETPPDPPWKAAIKERRAKQAERERQQREATETNRELLEKVSALEARLGQAPAQPKDPFEAARLAAERAGLTEQQFFEQWTQRMAQAGDPTANDALTRATKLEKELADVKEQLAQRDRKEKEATEAAQLRQLIDQDVEKVVDVMLPAAKEHLPWLTHASPRAVKQKARELIEYAAYEAEPGRYDGNDVIEALNEYFGEVYANVQPAAPAPTPPAERPRMSPLGNRAAADVSLSGMSEDERDKLAREHFARSLRPT